MVKSPTAPAPAKKSAVAILQAQSMTGQDLPHDREQAGRLVFERFTRRLIGLARSRLEPRLQNKVDPEDLVQSVYKSFFLRYGDDHLPEDIDGLWSLLTVITLRKCADRARFYKADRRDMAREAAPAATEEGEAWRVAVDREPTPDEAAVLSETVEQLLAGLSEQERPIIELSLQGYSTQEVSDQLGRAERSVRRLRERVRKNLERLPANFS